MGVRSAPLVFIALALCVACQGPRTSDVGAVVPSEENLPSVPAAPTSSEPADETVPPKSLIVERSWEMVVVDAGHGGDDEGAIGVSGAREKDITLAISREVSRGLRARGFKVIETRSSDEFLSLERRTTIANASGASLLLSIHANSAPSPLAHGVETYYMDLASDEAALRLAERENRSGLAAGAEDSAPRTGIDELISELRMGATAQQSRELAEGIHGSILSAGRDYYGEDTLRDRGVRTAPFWVLVDSQIPAVLVEVGYLTSEDEEKRVRTRGFHHLIADALVTAVANFSERAARVVPASER